MEGAPETSFEAKYEAILQLIFGSFNPIARSKSTKEVRETAPLGYAQPLKHSHPYLAISLPAYTMLRQRLVGH